MSGRIQYTEKFKLGAVAQVTDKGYSVTSVTGRLTPRFAFILFGVRLSRLDLGSVAVRRGLVVFGAATLLGVTIL